LWQQIEFFQSTDILISGHGAQLTGVPFLASKPCSQMLEIFPSQYFMPYYFGSLARYSGIDHSYMYIDDGDNSTMGSTNSTVDTAMPWELRMSTVFQERRKARSKNICLSGHVVKDILKELIENWYHCCHEQEEELQKQQQQQQQQQQQE
jgi:hypothetical protein